MVITTETREQWIESSLKITHDMLSADEVRYWENLFHNDYSQFYSSAVFGFAKRRFEEHGQEKFPGPELEEFCAQFQEKIRLAALGAREPSLPLFDICDPALIRQCQGVKDLNNFYPGGTV